MLKKGILGIISRIAGIMLVGAFVFTFSACKNSFGDDSEIQIPDTEESDTTTQIVAYYWIEQGKLTLAVSGTTNLLLSRGAGQSAIFTIQGAAAGYSGQRWFVNGVEVTGIINPSSYTFTSEQRQNGRYTVGLMVIKDNVPYYAEIIITVTD